MTDAGERRTAAWIAARGDEWRRLETRLPAMEDGRRAQSEVVFDAVRSYPEIARDLAVARRTLPGSATARQLERLYGRLHRGLGQPASHPWHDSIRLFRVDVPEIARELRTRILAVALGFFLAAAAGWWLVAAYPELARLFASANMIEAVQRGALWTDDLLNVMPSSVLAAQIFTNNIAVTVMAFALGAAFGLGTLYVIALNGLMIGAVFSLTAQYGLHGRLFEFVAAHGFVELSVIFVAGAVGFSIGEAVARPAHRSRAAAFARAASRGIKLMALCCVFLVGAGLIEGYVSPNAAVPMWAKVAVGLAYWLLWMLALCGFRLPRRKTSQAAGGTLGSGRLARMHTS